MVDEIAIRLVKKYHRVVRVVGKHHWKTRPEAISWLKENQVEVVSKFPKTPRPGIIVTTVAKSGSAEKIFDLVVIDEWGFLTEVDTNIAISRIVPGKGQFMLVGDHQQLPPIIKSRDLVLAVSLLERLWNDESSNV